MFPLVLEMERVSGLRGRIVSPFGTALSGDAALVRSRGQPLASELIGAVRQWRRASRTPWSRMGAIATSQTTVDGAFHFEDMPEVDDLWLAVSAEGYVPAWRRIDRAASAHPGVGDLHVGDLVVEPEVPFHGLVTSAGAPLVGVNVGYSRSPAIVGREGLLNEFRPIASVESDRLGRFSIGGLASGGLLDMVLDRPGFVTRELRGIRIDAAPGQSLLEVALNPAVEMTVRVTDRESGAPVKRVRTSYGPPGRRPWAIESSAPDGSVTLQGIPDRPGVLVVEARGFEPVRLPLEKPPRETLGIELERGDSLLRGVVVKSGSPLPGVRISIGSIRAETNDQGRFEVRLSAGERTIVVAWLSLDPIVKVSRPLATRPGLNEIVLDATPTEITGRVEWEDGRPVAGARVGAGAEKVRCGLDGHFTLQVFPGLTDFAAHDSDGRLLARTRVAVEAASRQHVVLVARERPRPVLRVRVTGLGSREREALSVHVESGPFGWGPCGTCQRH